MKTFQVTARKWRPDSLDKILGQQHITLALENSIKEKRVGHAYLFSGTRGVGKTSIARISAKMINCSAEIDLCCNECPSCIDINSSHSLDVREIDGASNRGIEQIRDIKEYLAYAPVSLKSKIFILDEAHMLTKEASNALLKVLEEPPAHVIFILATTEPNKILATIRSRCQHYSFKKIHPLSIASHLSKILDEENTQYDMSALMMIGHASKGSMRDAQSILDQILLCSNGTVSINITKSVLGIPPIEYFESILRCIKSGDIIQLFENVHHYLSEGYSEYSFAEYLTQTLRQCLFSTKVDYTHSVIEVIEEDFARLKILASQFSEKELYTLLNLAMDLLFVLKKEETSVFWIDNFLIKMMDYQRRIDINDLRKELLEVLDRQLLEKCIDRDDKIVWQLNTQESQCKNLVVSSKNIPTSMNNTEKSILHVKENTQLNDYTPSEMSLEHTLKNLFEIE